MSYVPSKPDEVNIYDLAGDIDLVATHVKDHSYKYELTLRGLSLAQLDFIAHAITQGLEVSFDTIAGSRRDQEIARILAGVDDDGDGDGSDSDGDSTDTNRSVVLSQPPAKKKKAKSRSSGSSRSRLSQDDVDDLISVLLGLGDDIDGLGKGDILNLCLERGHEVDANLWTKAIKEITTDYESWRVEGVKRGTKYFTV